MVDPPIVDPPIEVPPPGEEPDPIDPEDGAKAAPAPADEGARLIALNMALGGSSREQTAAYLAENFELENPDALLDDVYARAGK